MRVFVDENAVTPGSYRVVLQTGQRASFDSFLEHAAASSTVARADALAVLTVAAEWIESMAATGREADLGPLGRSRLGMKGKFTGIPERIEDADVQLTMSWVLPPALKRRVSLAGARLVRERAEALPKAPNPQEARAILQDAEPAPVPNRYVAGGALRVWGHRLDYDRARADEGVFLIAADGTQRKVRRLLVVQPKELLLMMPGNAAGPYRLEVRRRHPKQTGRLMVGRLDDPLEALTP